MIGLLLAQALRNAINDEPCNDPTCEPCRVARNDEATATPPVNDSGLDAASLKADLEVLEKAHAIFRREAVSIDARVMEGVYPARKVSDVLKVRAEMVAGSEAIEKMHSLCQGRHLVAELLERVQGANPGVEVQVEVLGV